MSTGPNSAAERTSRVLAHLTSVSGALLLVLAGASALACALMGILVVRLRDGVASWIPLAVYVIVLTVITLVTTFFTPETRGRDLTLLGDALADSSQEIAARPAPQTSSFRDHHDTERPVAV